MTMDPEVMDDILKMCCSLPYNEKLSLKSSICAKIMVGVGGFVGGIFGGLTGITVGAVVGGVLGRLMTNDDFGFEPQILVDLRPDQKLKLCGEVQAAMDKMEWEGADQLIAIVTSNSKLKEKVKAAVTRYITNELKAEVTCEE